MPYKKTFASKKAKYNPAPAEEPAAILPINIHSDRPIFFWKPDEQPFGMFCQWYLAPIVDEVTGQTYNCCEQFMMYHKALMANDTASKDAIIAAKNPAIQKRLGKEIAGFDPLEWDKIKYEVVARGNTLKFTQHPELRAALLQTGSRLLAEASRFDRVWGIGYGEADAEQHHPKNWGLNLLGKAIMEVREALRKEETQAVEEVT